MAACINKEDWLMTPDKLLKLSRTDFATTSHDLREQMSAKLCPSSTWTWQEVCVS